MRVIVKLAAGLVVAAVVLGAASYAVPRLGLAGKLPPAAREALARLPWAGAAVPKEPEKPVEYVPSPVRVPIGARAEELTPEQTVVLYAYYQCAGGDSGNLLVAERDLVSPSIRDLSQVEWEEALVKSAKEHGLRDIWEPIEIRVADQCLEPDSLGRIWVVVEVDARVTHSKERAEGTGHKGAVVVGAQQKYLLVRRDGVWYITAPRDGIPVRDGKWQSWID